MPPTRRGTLAVAYTRVSTARNEMISPELQAHEQDTYAARHGIKIVERVEDLDLSGREFARRSVDYIVAGIREGRWTTVLLWKWSRWGRNLLQSRLYLAEVEQAGGEVIAVTEDFDTSTSIGKFTRDQMLAIAELQSNQISEGWKEVQQRRQRMGLPHTGYQIFGYVYDKKIGYTADPVIGPVLKQLYERYVDGESLRQLSLWLNANGVRTTWGNKFTGPAVGRMLDSGFAAGLLRERKPDASPSSQSINSYQWYAGAQEAIISMDLWERYIDKRRETAERQPQARVAKHALTGLVECRLCHGRMFCSSGGANGRKVWRCRRKLQFGDCDGVIIGHDRLMRHVREWIENKAKGGEGVEEDAKRLLAAEQAVSNLEESEAEIDRLKVSRKRLLDLYVDGGVEEEDYRSKKAEIDTEMEEADRALRAAKAQAREAGTDYQQLFTTLSDMWDDAEPNEKRELLSRVIQKVVVWRGIGQGRGRHSRYRIFPKWAPDDGSEDY